MRSSTTLLLTLICFLVLGLDCFGHQSTTYVSTGWQGLTLDQSTPEDAIRALGQPISDKTDRLYIHNIDNWVTPKHKQKLFRILIYKNKGEVRRAELAFLEGKLIRVFLKFEGKEFPAKELSSKIGLDFVMVEKEVPSDSTPEVYEGQKESLVPKVYPVVYHLVSVTPTSLISAYVQSGTPKMMLKEAFRMKTKEVFPGSIVHIEMISRGLAKTKVTSARR
jgi:hypothetical protein